jgi:putative transposase
VEKRLPAELVRYVALNPLRAGIGAWTWSSYLAMIGLATTPDWLQTDWLLAQFDPQQRLALVKHMDFVCAWVVELPSVWNGLGNLILFASETFVAELQCLLHEEKEVYILKQQF